MSSYVDHEFMSQFHWRTPTRGGYWERGAIVCEWLGWRLDGLDYRVEWQYTARSLTRPAPLWSCRLVIGNRLRDAEQSVTVSTEVDFHNLLRRLPQEVFDCLPSWDFINSHKDLAPAPVPPAPQPLTQPQLEAFFGATWEAGRAFQAAHGHLDLQDPDAWRSTATAALYEEVIRGGLYLPVRQIVHKGRGLLWDLGHKTPVEAPQGWERAVVGFGLCMCGDKC